ncbi:19031_t:CDS:2, partial [Funneliformis geosporum]
KFRADINYQGLIEEVNTKDELEDQLCRFVHAMKKQDGSQYHVSSSILQKPINIMDKDQFYRLWQVFNKELLKIIDHSTMSGENLTSLSKDKYKGFEVIHKSKTNQRSANNIESQADKLYIPDIPGIIEMYETYFTKRPIQADPYFYLQRCNINEEQGLARYECPGVEIQQNNALNIAETFGFNESIKQLKKSL